ncbi:MAG TPA: hypothetical protein VLL76_01470 [Candidatus Omnitrophota bacterium]|nr:hypothetical protein [Candidatus Omnitrophota bacterium]
MFMFFNAIVIIVTGIASAAAISADSARDERCASNPTASECLQSER